MAILCPQFSMTVPLNNNQNVFGVLQDKCTMVSVRVGLADKKDKLEQRHDNTNLAPPEDSDHPPSLFSLSLR